MNIAAGGPLVSVIIPCYNGAEYLPYAVGSVLSQTHRNLEVVIVDDGSIDDTRTVATDLTGADARVRYLYGTHRGPSSARNHGLRSCSGEYVQFLDADDRLERRKLETHVSFLEQHPEIGLVYGDARVFTTEQPDLRWFKRVPGGGDGPWIEAHSRSPGTWLDRCLGAPPFHSCCPLFRKSLIDRYGDLDERLVASEDWELWIRLAAHGVEFAYHCAPEALALIRFSAGSLTSNVKRIRQGHLAMRRVIAHYLPDEIRPRNVAYGLAAIKRYYSPMERPVQVARLIAANWGPALRKELVRTIVKSAAETAPGRALRVVLRATIPYSWRHAIRARMNLADKE